MKHLFLAVVALGLVLAQASPSFSQNPVGEGIQKGAAVPGQAVSGAGRGVSKAGKAIQPKTGSAVVDTVGSVPGKIVEGTGTVLDKTGEVVEGVTDSVLGPAVTKSAKADLSKPANCKTAKQDIKTLEKERRSALDRMKNGAQSLFPISAAVRLLSGTYTDGAKVAIGNYNKDLDQKISQIKKTCGLS